MIASSISSPPTRSDCETTIPPSEITATSVVPPPTSTIMLPVGSATGRPAPIAAAIGSSIRYAWRAPALSVASSTARFSTPVTPEGTHTTTRGCANRGNRSRRAPEHPLRLDANGVHLAGSLVNGDYGGLGEHDPAAADIHECVGRAKVHGHIAAAEAAQPVKEPHRTSESRSTEAVDP